MAKVIFKSEYIAQPTLFPCDIGELIPENAPVRLINKIVNKLDLTELYAQYHNVTGRPCYHPKKMLKVVILAYLNNTYSCRDIAELMRNDINYIWVSGNERPSYVTINRFRSERLKDVIMGLFVQVVQILVELEVLSIDVQYVDGTKIESVANRYTFVWRKTVEKKKARVEEKIKKILEQVDEGIAQDNAAEERADSEPAVIDSELLQEKIDEIKRRNESRPKETPEQKQVARAEEKNIKALERCQDQLSECEEKLEILGNRNSYSKTDHDATFMCMKEDKGSKIVKPGYNLQIATFNQMITNFGIFPNPADYATLPPLLYSQLQRYAKYPITVVADAGYGSEENYHMMEENGIEAYVKFSTYQREKTRAFKLNPFLLENMHYNEKEDYFVCPMGQHMTLVGIEQQSTENGYTTTIHHYQAQHCDGCPLRSQCTKKETGNRTLAVNHNLRRYKQQARERLASDEGIEHRKRRSIEPEPVFGQMKFNKGYKRFRHRGADKVTMDFAIFAIAFNLQKLWRHLPKGLLRLLFSLFFAHFRPIFALIRPFSAPINSTHPHFAA